MGSGDWKGKRLNEIVPARTIVWVVRVTESGFARDAGRSGEQADYDEAPGLLASLDCLKPLGLIMVSFGNASGKVPPFDFGILSQKGSLYLSRPTLATYTATRADLGAAAHEVFEVIRKGQGEGRDPAHLSARGGGAGASRPGRPQDVRLDRVVP